MIDEYIDTHTDRCIIMCVFGGRRGITIEGCFCSYSLYFASLIRDESRTERRAMVLEAANGGGLCHPGSGRGVPLVSSTEALRNHR